MLELSPREPQQKAVDGRLVLWEVDRQEQGCKRIGDGPVGAFGPARVIDDGRRDRREVIDQLKDQNAATMGELLPPEAIDREAQQMRLVFLAGSHAGIAARVRRRGARAAPPPL